MYPFFCQPRVGDVEDSVALRGFNYLQEELLGEGEPGEMLQAGDGKDQEEGLVHLAGDGEDQAGDGDGDGDGYQAGDGEDQEEGLVHLRLADWDPQLILCPRKHRKHSALLRPIGAAVVSGEVALDFLQPVIL